MADIDPIVIPIQVSKDDSLDVLDQKLQDIGQSATDLRESLDSPIPMFGDGMIDRLRIIEASVERMRKASMTLKENENAPDYHRSLATFRQDMSRMAATINDLRQSAAHSSSLNAQLGEELSATFTAGLRQHIPALMATFRSTAESMVKASGTQSDQSLIEAFTHTAAYKNVQRMLAENDATTYSPENMMRMVKAILPVAVPQYLRASHLGWMNEHVQISRVRDMLPASFSHISFRDTSERAFNKTARQLDGNELAALRKIVRDNPYLAPEFERAGLMKREHGRAYFNNEASEENVNSLGGLIARMFTIGIKGRYSTRGDDPENNDIEYPFLADKFLKRTNMYVSQSRKIAEELSEAFPWMNPEYVEKATLPKSRKSWSTMGDFRARPRQTTSEFLEFGMNEFDENGRIIFDQTEDGKPIKKFLPVNNSLMQRKLAQQAGADPFEHNGFNRNEIFMRLPLDELSDYHTTEERREEIRQRLIHAISEDKYTEDGSRYVFSGLSNNHAVFTRADIKQAIESQDPNFFRNGETQSVFTSQDENSGGKSAFERFGRAMDAAKKARTDTEDIREVYGSDLSDIKVVVADWQKVTGMDGQNIISRKYAPETFQGRDYGGKSTYQAIDMAALFEMYPQFRQANGDMLIPGAAVGGGDLLIPHDVGLIEEWGNIKAKAGYSPTMTQEEINKRRTEEVRREGIGMKTTAGAAATDTRYISAQAAASMTIGKAAREYFDRVFNYELASLEDIDAVKKLLFSGDDYLSRQVQADEAYLNSAEARRRIEEYRDSLWARRGKGDILLPQGSSNYAMISAWLPDVFNHLVEEAGFELTDEQKRLSLRENVAYFASASDELAMFRNPATASGNIRATNKSAADASREYFEKVANMLGVDANALYVDPRAEILKKMQSADIDGDTLFVTALKHNKEFGEIMSAIMTDTAEAYKQLEKKADFKEGELDQIKEARTKPVGEAKDSYSMDDKEDVVNHLIASQGAIAKMGAADAVARNSRQNQMTKNVARAIMLGEEHYDVDSNGLAKKGREWLTTAEEWAMLREGAPFTQIVNWANKATKQLHPDAKPEFDQESFNQRNVDKVNFSSVNMGSALIPMYSRFYQAAMGKPVRDGHDWDMIFEKLPYVDTDTHAGKLTQRLRELKLGQMKGEFLAFDDSLVAELKGLAQNAMGEIIQSVVSEHPEMTSAEQQREANRRYAESGGFVVANLAKFGLTRDNIRANPELAREMADMEARTGRSVYAQGRDFTIEYADAFDLNAAQAREAEAKKKRDETKAEVDRKAAITKEALERVEEYRDREISDEAQREAEELRSLIADKELQLQNPFSEDPDSTLSVSDKQRLRTEIAAHRKRLEEVDPKGVAEERLQAAQADEIFAKQENEKAVQSWREADLAARTVHDYIQRQAEFDRIVGGAEEFSRELKSSVRAKEAKLSDATAAELFYDKRQGLANYYISQLDDLSSQGNFDEAQRAQMTKLQEQIRRNVDEEFAQKAVLNADYLQEDIVTRIAKLNGTYDPRTEELKTLGTQIENAKSYRDILLNMAKRVGAETNEGKDFITRADGITAKIGEIESQYTEYAGLIEDERIDKETQRKLDQELRNARAAKRTERLLTNSKKLKRDPFRIRSNNFFDQAAERRDDAVDRYDNQIESLREDIARKQASRQKLEVGSEDYKKATAEIEKLTAALHNAEDASKSLAGAGGIASAAFAQMGESVTRVVQQFGRQMFHQAANEVKRFVQQYNADMTTIQMITLKTDEEISNLGADLIDTAIDLKVSVSDVTTAASEIYRQGLTDEEVDVRLEDTMKFSKVAGIKAEEASKILTTAMTNGLVETSEEAMDALVALDDSVATSASEIAKGMQKSAASAKEAGMSYQELVTSLAIITSRTQLGGSTAGTALSTLMYRLFRVNKDDGFYDENGNYIAKTDTSDALANLGVDLYDDSGNFRGPYQILVDIAKNWENANDTKRSMLLSTLGAGRQRSNMATLIQGLAEDGGALAERYIDLASNSQGIADEKYLIYLESLPAAITNVQNSFDELIASFNVGETATGFLNLISNMLQGLVLFNEATDGVVFGIIGITTAMVALGAAVHANPLFWGITAAGAAIAGITSAIGHAIDDKKNDGLSIEDASERMEEIRREEAEIQTLITRMEELNGKTNRTTSEQAELDAGMQQLSSSFSVVGAAMEAATSGAQNYTAAIDAAKTAVANLTAQQKKSVIESSINALGDRFLDDASVYADENHPLYAFATPENAGATIFRAYGQTHGIAKLIENSPEYKDLYESLGWLTKDGDPLARGAGPESWKPYYDSFLKADKTSQQRIYKRALLQEYENIGYDLTKLFPEHVFDQMVKNGHFTAEKMSETFGASGLGYLDKDELMNILRTGKFSSAWMQEVYGGGEDATYGGIVPDIIAHVYDIIGDGLLRGQYDDMQSEGIKDAIESVIISWIEAFFPDADTDALSAALQRRILEATEGKTDEKSWVAAAVGTANEVVNTVFKIDEDGNFVYDEKALDSFIDDPDKRKWEYFDEYGAWRKGFSQDEARQKLLESGRKVEGVKEVFSYSVGEQAGLTKEEAEDAVAKNKEKINKAQDQSEELAAPTAPYYVEGVPYDSLADAKEAVFMKFRSENADKSLSDVIRAFGEQEKMLLSSFIRPGTGTKPMYGGVEYDTYEQALAQYEADKQAIASQVKGLPVNILRKHDGYEYQGKKYTTEADAIIDAAIDQGYLRSYVVSTPPTNENALSAASKLLQDAGDVYKSTNKTAFEVDALIEEMISENVGSFADLMSGVNGNKLKGLKNALSLEDGRLGFLLSKGVTDQGDGSFSFDESFWNEFYTLLTRNSYSYQGTFDPTRNEEANAAQKALNDLLSGKKYEDVSSADLETILSATDLYPLIRSGSLTGENLQYANMLLSNYRYGMDGLSQMQQSYGANTVLDAIMEGRAAELIGSTTEGTRSAYMSGVSSMPELLAAAEAIESFNISGVNSLSDFLELDVDSDTYAEVARQLKSIGINAEDIDDVLRDVQDEVTKLEKKYGDLSDEISDGAKKWRGSTKDLASAQTELNRTLTAAANNQYYRQLFRKGDRSPEVLQAISEQVHIDKDAIEDNMDIVLETLDTLESADIESVESSINAMFEGLGTFDEIAVQMPDVVAEGGSVDLTTVANQLVGDAQAQVQDAIRRLQMISAGGVFDFSIDENGNASIKFRVTDQTGLGGLGAGRKSGGGGGGGGGKKKSAAETLLEKQDHESTVTDHIIKMIQYEQTMYKNADELTNYGIMLQHEIDEEKRQVEVKKQNIAALKEEIAKTEQLSDDWYSLRDAIMKAEEELKDLQNTIDENLDALKENEQAILKLHTDLEQTVKAEIENRLQREEDMLAGSVSLQETILEAIRQRYRDEWELMQEDIEKKKEALQEEISLIDERLQRRKDAEDEAEKHEQLAEYKRQLAMISLDSTRTADQAELRKKIAELEKEIAWDVAEDEAEAQKQGLQDQIDAYDEYVEEHQKELDDLLENANNFAEEVNGVMRLNQDELFAWLKENVQEYANSLGDAQKQMLNTWEDTFKQMKGITDTYWADIAKILSSKESFIEYMKGSQEYINASEDEKKQLIYGWELMYDTYINANKVSDEAVDYTHDDTDYTTSTDTSTSSGSTTKYRSYYTVYDAKTGAPYQGYGVGSTQEEADRVAAKLKQDKLNSGLYVATKPNIVEGGGLATGQGGLTPNTGDILAPGSFSEGGYVDYTGLAMVHGSPSRPEAFLSADDTSMIRSLLDSWKYIKTKPVISNIDSLFGGRGDTNVGEVNVVINQAELKEDADFEEVARRVGEAFTKELAKQGFNTAAYAL